MSQFRVEVRAKGASEFHFEIVGPAPLFPRVGERVAFADGMGRVESVTWRPETFAAKQNANMTVIVECVPDAET